MKSVFGYIRVSTPRQGERGVSLQEQRDAIIKYCARHGLLISRWFEERETAAKSGRRAFNEMLRLLRQRKVAGLVVHKVDRSARNLRDWASLGELLDEGVEVHFANESLDLNSRGGRLSADIQAVVASDYIRNLKEEVRKGLYGRIKQGLYPFRAPIGYLNCGGGQPKAIDPVKGPKVRELFELYASGRYSLGLLTEKAEALGLSNERGGLLHVSGIAKLLRNPFYLGLIRLKVNGETYPGVHPALISKSLFDAVQAVLDGRFAPRQRRHEYLFRRLLTCAACKNRLVGERQKGFVYYRCHTTDCPGTCVRETLVDDAHAATFERLVFTRAELQSFSDEIARIKKDMSATVRNEEQALKIKLAALTNRLARLTDAYTDGLLEHPLFMERKEALLVERLEIQQKLERLTGDAGRLPQKLAELLERSDLAYLSYKMGDPSRKRELVETLSSNRTVNGKNVSIKLFPEYEAVANRPSHTHGGLHKGSCRTWIERLAKLVMRQLDEQSVNYSQSIPDSGIRPDAEAFREWIHPPSFPSRRSASH